MSYEGVSTVRRARKIGKFFKKCFERVCHVQHAGRFFLFDTVMLCSDHQNKVIRDY